MHGKRARISKPSSWATATVTAALSPAEIEEKFDLGYRVHQTCRHFFRLHAPYYMKAEGGSGGLIGLRYTLDGRFADLCAGLWADVNAARRPKTTQARRDR